MLAKKYRLTNKSDFEKIKEKGLLFQSESFGMAVLQKEEKNPPRFGFIVSTKISKKAVARNRARRKLREAVKKYLKNLKEGYNVLFLAKGKILEGEGEKINKEVYEVFKKAELFK